MYPNQKTTTPATIASLNFAYNLGEVISHSLKFFKAQRSGTLPSDVDNDDVTWRSHSAIRDGSDRGLDLSGGYYVGWKKKFK